MKISAYECAYRHGLEGEREEQGGDYNWDGNKQGIGTKTTVVVVLR